MRRRGWLTTTQAGRVLGLARTTVFRWVHSGAVPGQFLLRIGTRTYVSRAWVEQDGRRVSA